MCCCICVWLINGLLILDGHIRAKYKSSNHMQKFDALLELHNTLCERIDHEKEESRWRKWKADIRKADFLAVGETWKATFWPTVDFKEGNCPAHSAVMFSPLFFRQKNEWDVVVFLLEFDEFWFCMKKYFYCAVEILWFRRNSVCVCVCVCACLCVCVCFIFYVK